MSPSKFQIPGWNWLLPVGVFITTHYMLSFHPSLIPLNYLGPIGSLLRPFTNEWNHTTRNVVHVVEGILAVYWARKAGASITEQCLWFIQTFILGFCSLRLSRKLAKQHTQ